jgi:hypothetical protein
MTVSSWVRSWWGVIFLPIVPILIIVEIILLFIVFYSFLWKKAETKDND